MSKKFSTASFVAAFITTIISLWWWAIFGMTPEQGVASFGTVVALLIASLITGDVEL